MASRRPSPAPNWFRTAAIALVVVGLNAWLLAHFHDRFWWPPDEGNYAHVAERILDGEVLHAQIQDIHPGYVNFANAGALALFGRRLTSMRYPLALLGIVQSLLLFLVLRPAGPAAAGVGATAITALGFLQFLDPTAHWYCLFLVVLLAAVLHIAPRTARWRLDAIGAIVMTIVLFRQLSGVLVAMGALTWLLLEPGDDGDTRPDVATRPTSRASRPWVARATIAIMLVGLGGYLARSTDAVGWLLFGIWPVLVLLQAVRLTETPNGRVLRMLPALARGGIVAALPLVAYHLANGSLGAWYHDALETALGFPRMPFFDAISYADLLAEAWRSLATGEPAPLLNGAYWLVLPFVAAVVGVRMLMRLGDDRGPREAGAPPALPILAVFYGVVSVHYQIPIYLAYTVGLSLAALICLTRGSRAATAATAALAAIAVVYHAGQPLSRGVTGATRGERVALVESDAVPRIGVRIEPSDVQLYETLLGLIERDVPPSGSILAIPSRAELYFLSGRRNPFWFYNSALGVTTERELEAVLAGLERDPPGLVFYDRRDKYNTPASRAIMERVAATYEPLPGVGPFEIYRHPGLGDPVAAREAAPSSSR